VSSVLSSIPGLSSWANLLSASIIESGTYTSRSKCSSSVPGQWLKERVSPRASHSAPALCGGQIYPVTTISRIPCWAYLAGLYSSKYPSSTWIATVVA
jgi:hypothetical protein